MEKHIKIMPNPEQKNRDEIDNIKKRLREGPELINCDIDELKYIKKPIGKSIYKYANEEKKEIKKEIKKKYIKNEYVMCDLCGGKYTRSNKCYHEKTKHHMTYKIVNDKFKQLILN